jgi:hypothetical protein
MNAKKKHLSTKAEIRAEKERQRRIATVIFAALILIVIVFSAYFGYQILSSSSPSEEETTLPEPSLQFKPENPNPLLKAAIVDQLSFTFPNKTFIEVAATTLTTAGYTVDYYSGEKVTVKFYRNLPSYGYRLIIFRVHTTGRGAFFTSEGYSKSLYVWEQLNDQIWRVSYDGNEPFYFGISPSFVKSCMNGRFDQTIIVAMGCTTLQFNDMAQAFIGKGARVYIGWTGLVSASHTDTATTRLLHYLLIDKLTIKNAIRKTMEEVGTDPISKVGSHLAAFPEQSCNYAIQNP